MSLAYVVFSHVGLVTYSKMENDNYTHYIQ